MAPRKRGGMAGSFEPPAGSITRSDDAGIDGPESGGTDFGVTQAEGAQADVTQADVSQAGPEQGTDTPFEGESTLSGPAFPAGSPEPAPVALVLGSESAAPAPVLADTMPAESPVALTEALPATVPEAAPQPASDTVTASASAIGSVTGLGLAAFVGGGFLMMGLGAAVGAYYSVALAEQYVRRVGGLGRPGAA